MSCNASFAKLLLVVVLIQWQVGALTLRKMYIVRKDLVIDILYSL